MHPFLKTALIIGIAACFFSPAAMAQSRNAEKLKERISQLQQQKNYLEDTAYFNTLNKLAFVYAISYPDSAIALLTGQTAQLKAIHYREGEADTYKIFGNAYQSKGDFEKALKFFNQAYELAEKSNYKKALPGILNNIGLAYLNLGNYPIALDKFYKGLKLAEANNDQFVISRIISNVATIHFYQGKMEEAASDYLRMRKIAESTQDTIGIIFALNNIGEVNLAQDSVSKALQNFTIARSLATRINNPETLVAITKNLGIVYTKMDSLPKAIGYFEVALQLARKENSNTSICKVLIELAAAQNKSGMQQQALANALEAVQLAKKMGQSQLIRDASEITSNIYEALGDGSNALKQYKVYKVYADSISNLAGERAALTYKSKYELTRQQLEFERKALQKNWIIFSALAALLSICIIAWIINRNRNRLNQTNKILQQKNEVIAAEKSKAEAALTQLKTTQNQLIQAEKMASLGVLTAGIAHEIQNPLNFVNNFSDINTELLDEMEEYMDKGEILDAQSIAKEVRDNNQKVAHHGKRVDAIVKSMLQHSQVSGGQNTLTDINALAGDYIKLSYLESRTKDNVLNITIETDFDESIGKINIVPQDVGRVILNLLRNALYSVDERKKTEKEFVPVITVSTQKTGDKVLISVTDNGTGIPHNSINKIFQPFFTTKPTGQGTGLGLSLSYDIIKANGGEITVQSEVGGNTTFNIILNAQ